MPVTYLEIENFKSYAGKQTIGPFRDFSSIIGPNGSGKSNLMDAISFVLGVQSRDLRSSQMKDLIFRPPGTRRQTLKACVTLFFQDDDDEMTFARAISPQGHGEYIVNGKTMPFKEYEAKLADIGVLVKARNFLVFQGDVESIARKSPKDFVALLEQISTSVELAGDYDDAHKAKEEAEAAVLEEYNRQKGFKSERRLLKEQKEEAERFQELLAQKAKLQTDLYLWQLYHIDNDIREQEDTLAELRKELEEKKQDEEEYSKALRAAKKKASEARRHTGEIDKNRVNAASHVDTLEPLVITCTEEIKSLQKKISTTEKSLAKKKKEANEHKYTLEQIETNVDEHKEQLKQLETDYEEIKRDAVGNQVTLTEEQEEELVRVRQAAAAATVNPRRKLGGLTRKLNHARSKAQTQKQEYDDAKKSLVETEQAVTGHTERTEKLKSSMESTKVEVEQIEKELLEAQQAMQQTQERREELDQELEKINRTLRDAKDSRRKSKDEERIAQAIAALKRNFPGVMGRLVDLCRPTQARFNLAITVAAGKDMEAIVVDTKETGHECIRHLREQRIGTATFLPLDSLQVTSVESQERARALVAKDNRYRLAADCITADEVLKPAVLYAVGNTVVCDDLDCARELCFGSRQGGGGGQAKIKAVTLGGAVISKAGTMTGGVTRDDSNKAGRWGAAEIEKMREKKEVLETERSELESSAGDRRTRRGPGGHSSRIEELKNNLFTLKSRSDYAKRDLAYTNSQLREKQNQVKTLRRQVTKLEGDMETVESEITDLQEKVETAREEVKNAEEEHLRPFREKTGLKDLGAYEDAVGERRKDFNEQRNKLLEHIAQLEQKKDYETKRDLKKPVTQLEKRIQDNKAKLKKSKEKEKELAGQVDEAKEALAGAEDAVKEAAEKEEECDEEVQVAQTDYNEAQGERNKAKKAVNAGEAAVERLRGTLHETLQKARVEEVELPMLDEGSDDEEGVSSSQVSSSQMQTQDSSSGGGGFSQSTSRVVVRDRRAASKVDYSKLDEPLKQRPSDREEKRMKKDFEDQINKLASDIEATNPNMKAADAFDAVSQRLKSTNTDYSKAQEAQRKAASAFQKIKSRRAKLFNDCFNHIDESLKTIYRDMTKSSKHPLGGEAYLSLDDTEEPYKGGMKFNAMPPMKRFRDMEQLSGGEKTVAALSLLFAIHSYHPAPFFVMDEVDAALDNINLRKVCNYISHRSKTDFQCIVISLKDMFYERSESLIGVCRDVGTSSSRTLTLDLTTFDKKEAKKKGKRGGKKQKSVETEEEKTPGRKRKTRLSQAGEEEEDEQSKASEASKQKKTRRSKATEQEEGDEHSKASKRKTRRSKAADNEVEEQDDEEEATKAEASPSPKRRKTRRKTAADKSQDEDGDDASTKGGDEESTKGGDETPSPHKKTRRSTAAATPESASTRGEDKDDDETTAEQASPEAKQGEGDDDDETNVEE